MSNDMSLEEFMASMNGKPEDKVIFERDYWLGQPVRLYGTLVEIEFYDDDTNLVGIRYLEDNPDAYVEEGDRAMHKIQDLKPLSEGDDA